MIVKVQLTHGIESAIIEAVDKIFIISTHTDFQ